LGTVHVAVSNETSSHVILRTSPDLAAVKTVSRKALDAVVSTSASRVIRAGTSP